MGIFGAMTTAVSGLRSQAYALENISGNIANSQTTGFKRVETSFVDLLPDMPYRKELAGSVTAFSRLTNTIQGDLQSTGVSTNMSVNGEGFFIVQERTGFQNNVPTFGGVDLYTRRGDFTLDKDGFLVNGAGLYLRGSSINPITGDTINGGNGVVRVSSEPLGARQTSQIVYRANLPTRPGTTTAVAELPGSELLQPPPSAPPAPAPAFPSGYDPRITSLPAASGSGVVVGSDANRFMNQSIEGGLIPAYNAVGARIDIQMRWAKVLGAAVAATSTAGNISAGLPQSGGGALTINGTSVALASGDSMATIVTKINTAAISNITASLDGSNHLVLTDSTAANLNIAGTGVTLSQLGLSANPATSSPATGTGTSGLRPDLSGNIIINGTTIALADGDSQTAILNKINGQTATTKVAASVVSGNLVLNAIDTNSDVDIGAGSTSNTLAALGLSVGTTSPTPTAGETWNLFYMTNSTASNNTPAWINVGVPFVFNNSGQMIPLAGPVTVNNLNVDGNNVGDISFDFGNGGLTQYASADGRVQQSTLQQDGYSSGVLDSVSVTSDGRISGSYTNGRVVTVAAISIAQFNADNALRRRDGGVYEQTLESGLPIIGLNGSTIIGGNVEGSNTDIAEEFSKMIVTQQAYSANTRVVTTSQQMLSDVLNMVR